VVVGCCGQVSQVSFSLFSFSSLFSVLRFAHLNSYLNSVIFAVSQLC
jgi:hypothetical protein